MNIRGLAGLALFCALVGDDVAASAPLCVHALCLPRDADWRRGSTEQERAEDAFILELAAGQPGPTQVLLLRAAPLVRGDAETYYERVTRFWHAQYGPAAPVTWQEAAGARWRSLRRPARASEMGLFQLVTVYDGRAYSLLVFVPGSVTTLPAPVRRLLEGIRFGVAETPAAPKPVPEVRWLRVGVQRGQASAENLEKRALAEIRRLGDGMLTGYGLRYGESAAEWFMDGFVWRGADANAERTAWNVRGALRVEAPAEWSDAAPWTLSLSLPAAQEAVSARLSARVLCGQRETLRETLRRLERGATDAMQDLAAPCATLAVPVVPALLRGEAGKTVSATLRLPAPTLHRAAMEGGDAVMGLVEVRLETEPGRRLPGEAVIGGVRLVFAYEPANPQ